MDVIRSFRPAAPPDVFDGDLPKLHSYHRPVQTNRYRGLTTTLRPLSQAVA